MLDENLKSIQLDISAIQPRLMRFASILAGDAASRDGLMNHCFAFVTANHDRLENNSGLAAHLFSEIYGAWVAELGQPGTQSAKTGEHGETTAFLRQEMARHGTRVPDDTINFIASLPPQQRAALLLVYGEQMSHEDAAAILDTPVDFVVHAVTATRSGLTEAPAMQTQAPASRRRASAIAAKLRRAAT